MTKTVENKSVIELNGAVRFDPVLRTYIVRIPADQFPNEQNVKFYLEVSGKLEQLEYDDARKIYYNNYLKADAPEVIENGKIIVK